MVEPSASSITIKDGDIVEVSNTQINTATEAVKKADADL